MALCEFFFAPRTFPRQSAKSFDTVAILCDGKAKRQTIARYPAEHYVSCWIEREWPPLGVLEAVSEREPFETVVLI